MAIGLDKTFRSDSIVGATYQLVGRIGSGSFGQIYSAVNTKTGEEVAVKRESVNGKHLQLPMEARIYSLLEGGVGIPRILWSGQEQGYNVLVMDLLGPSLEQLFNRCGRVLTMKSVLMLADQMIQRLEFVHSKSIIHRDVKPDNFAMGTGRQCGRVFLIDFGLSKAYRSTRNHKHIPYKDGKPLTGTARYASLNSHLGNERGFH
jgi:serine/threonine protein kinase